jgi:hypothetical protein
VDRRRCGRRPGRLDPCREPRRRGVDPGVRTGIPGQSLLPQFASPGRGAVGVLPLGLLFCLLTFAWLAGYSVAVAGARRLLARPRVRRLLDALTGCVLIGFGARLAAGQR